MKISGLLITYQCLIQDYPVEACIRSLLDIADIVYVNDGYSTDGTLELLNSLREEYGSDRVVIIKRKWDHDKGFWARERNYILDNYVEPGWVLSLDADEVLHEDEFKYIKNGITNSKHKSIAFRVIHFYGTPFHTISGYGWFNKHTQLWHTDTGIRWLYRPNGCADDIVWPDGKLAHIVKHEVIEAKLYHYGHCRSPKAMGMKMKRANDLYQHSKDYISGNMAELTSWEYDMNRALPYDGTHPKYVKDWVELHRNQDTSFIVGG